MAPEQCPPLSWTISNRLAEFAPYLLDWYFRCAPRVMLAVELAHLTTCARERVVQAMTELRGKCVQDNLRTFACVWLRSSRCNPAGKPPPQAGTASCWGPQAMASCTPRPCEPRSLWWTPLWGSPWRRPRCCTPPRLCSGTSTTTQGLLSLLRPGGLDNVQGSCFSSDGGLQAAARHTQGARSWQLQALPFVCAPQCPEAVLCTACCLLPCHCSVATGSANA